MISELIRITHKQEHAHSDAPFDDQLVLTLDRRDKARQRVRLESGREAGLFLERGQMLKDGDILVSEDGLRIRVKAARETLSQVTCQDPRLLIRIAYHLGNRHAAVQIGENTLTYLHDHVLDAMVKTLGGCVQTLEGVLHPEDGAYHGGGHAH
jgi:urease accessory protein